MLMFVFNFNVNVKIFELPPNLLHKITEKYNFNVHSRLQSHVHRPNTSFACHKYLPNVA
jgi:hypothetical protein